MSELLVELGSETESKAKFSDALTSTLGKTSTDRCLDFKLTVELCDLHELTTAD